MVSRNRKAIPAITGLALSAVGLFLILRGLDWGVLGDTMGQARLGWLLAAVVVEMLSLLANAVRWRWLYWPHHQPPVGKLFGVLTVAQLANTVLPGRLGLLVRAVMTGGDNGPSRATTITTLVVEKVLEGVTLLPLGVLLSLLLDLPDWVRISAAVSGCVLLALLLLLGSGLRWRDHLVDWIAKLSAGWPAGLMASLLEGLDALRSTRVAWRIWGWSLLYWGLVTAVNWLVIQATGLPLPALASLALLFVLQIGVRVPASPGNIGVYDFLGVVTLALFGLEKSAALGVTLLLHLVTYLPPSLVGVVYLWWANAWPPLSRQLNRDRV